MRDASLSFLKSILEAPSPSGFEQPVQRLWAAYVKEFADEVSTDSHGNTIGVLNPGGSPRVMLAGHADELGFMVKYIDDNGFLAFAPIGGYDTSIVPGRRVLIHARGGVVDGVIGKRAIHLLTPKERESPETSIEKFWIDIGVKDKDEATSLVEVGDPVTYPDGYKELRNGLATSRGIDDKIGSFMVAETLRTLAERKSDLKAAVYGVSTVQEEIGLRGATTSAFGVNPDVGVAIDVTHATDSPDMDKRKLGDVTLGAGPTLTRGANVNSIVFDRLVSAAKSADAPYQVEGAPRGTGTDANAIQLTRAGVATGLMGVPLRYMHTAVEIMSLSDVENGVKILAEFCTDLSPELSFSLE